ncbi:hypothetical protein BRD19_09780 [Halobacteriales archaeon SW_7_65_23]|nr:MAG: hypothetical protein BRD19_09780 [Halobacteriales archaeon SW_7_65_23]
MSDQTLLIPVVFPEPDLSPMDDMHLAGLRGFNIVLSGYWEVPAGVSPETVRDDHGTEAEAVLYDIAAQFSRAGASTDIQLQFGSAGAGEREYQNRLVAGIGADGVLLADRLQSMHNLLVPLRDSRHQAEIVDLVSAFDAGSLFILELYHVAAEEAAVEAATEMLRDVEETLLARGFSEADLEVTVEVADDPKAAIAAIARDHHIVVMGETQQPEASDQLFGPVCTYIAEESGTPIIVVRE